MFSRRTQTISAKCLVGVIILILTYGWAGHCNEKEKTLDAQLKIVLNATNRPGVSAAYESLFEKVEPEKLCAVGDDRFTGIALRASWEKVKRSVPERMQDRSFELDRGRLSRFLGFCEGRLKVTLPRWWEQTVLSAKANGGRCAIGFTFPEQCRSDSKQGGIGTPKNVKLMVRSGFSTLTEGENEISLPKNILDHAKRNVGARLVPVFGKDIAIVASHIGICSPFEVYCIDRKTNKTRWKAYVWATGAGFGGFVEGGHFVSMQLSQSQLTIFGAGPDCVYIEAFAITDGKLLFRFCTAY